MPKFHSAVTGKYEIDMCRGSIAGNIIRFALPVMFTNALQHFFYLADMVVIGRFAGADSLAAIGVVSVSSCFIIELFIGFALGANVLAARAYGAGDRRELARVVRTTAAMALWGGAALALLGIAVSHRLLTALGTPPEILPKAMTYQVIIFLGIPFLMLGNVGCALLRAVGDTRRPLAILLAAGSVNAVLNLVAVAWWRLDVAGVAIATVFSQALTVVLLWRVMRNPAEPCHLSENPARLLQRAAVDRGILIGTLRIGIPAGVENSCYSFCNMVIQVAINGFGSLAIAGNTAAASLETFSFALVGSTYAAAISFIAQNHGGGEMRRIRQSFVWLIGIGMLSALIPGLVCFFFGPYLLAVFNADPAVIAWGMRRLVVIGSCYAICGLSGMLGACLRAFGRSFTAAAISLVGVCLLRIVWARLIFPLHPTMEWLMVSYPVSWVLVSTLNGVFLALYCRRLFHGENGGGTYFPVRRSSRF